MPVRSQHDSAPRRTLLRPAASQLRRGSNAAVSGALFSPRAGRKRANPAHVRRLEFDPGSVASRSRSANSWLSRPARTAAFISTRATAACAMRISSSTSSCHSSKATIASGRSGGTGASAAVSMGGYGALRLAFRYPELFGSVSAHSAALVEKLPDAAGSDPREEALARILGPAFGSPFDRAFWERKSPFTLARNGPRPARLADLLRLRNRG